MVICVSLRMAASAEAPSSLMLLSPILQARGGMVMVREKACQWALTQKRTLWGGGAPERGHGTPLEPLAQLGDALRGVGASAAQINAAELVAIQAAKGRRGGVNGR